MSSAGIRHVHLLVSDHNRAAEFYRDAFGMDELFRDGPIVFSARPGAAIPSRSILQRPRKSELVSASRVDTNTLASTYPTGLVTQSTRRLAASGRPEAGFSTGASMPLGFPTRT